MTRRQFFAVGGLAVAEAAFYGATLRDRLKTRETKSKEFRAISSENRDKEIAGDKGIECFETVRAQYGGEKVTLHFIGVRHADEDAKRHSERIVQIMKENNASVLCSEFTVAPMGMTYKDIVSKEPDGYFVQIAHKALSEGFHVALIEASQLNRRDYLAGLASHGIILGAAFKIALKLCGPFLRRKAITEAKEKRLFKVITKAREKAPSSFYAGHLFAIPFATNNHDVVPSFGMYIDSRRNDNLSPMSKQRNRFFAEALKKVINEGHRDIVIVTGAAHTYPIINRLNEGLVPASASFKEHFIVLDSTRIPRRIYV